MLSLSASVLCQQSFVTMEYLLGLLTVLLGLSTGIVLCTVHRYYSVFSGEMDAGLGMCTSAALGGSACQQVIFKSAAVIHVEGVEGISTTEHADRNTNNRESRQE